MRRLTFDCYLPLEKFQTKTPVSLFRLKSCVKPRELTQIEGMTYNYELLRILNSENRMQKTINYWNLIMEVKLGLPPILSRTQTEVFEIGDLRGIFGQEMEETTSYFVPKIIKTIISGNIKWIVL